MYMVGGSGGRVHRSGKPYPGATRFLQPERPRINWRQMISDVVGGLIFGFGLLYLVFILALGLG